MNAYLKKEPSNHKTSCLNLQQKGKTHEKQVCKTKKAESSGKKEYLNRKDKSKFNSKSSKSKKSDESQYHRNQYKKNPDRIQYYNQENFKTEKKNPRKSFKEIEFKQKTNNPAKNLPPFRIPNYIKKKNTQKKAIPSSRLKDRVSEFHERTPSKQKISILQKRKSQRSSIMLFGGGKSQQNLQKRSKSASNIIQPQKNKLPIKIKKKNPKSKTPKKSFHKINENEKAKAYKKQDKEKQKCIKNSEVTKQFTKSSLEPKPQQHNPIQELLGKVELNLSEIRDMIVDEFSVVKEEEISAEIIRERFKSLNMLGKICYSMQLKKSSFMLAIAYMDRFLDNKININSIKAVTIASLMISLKVEHAQIFGNIEYQFCDNTTCESRELPRMIKPVLTTQKPKIPHVLNIVLSHEEIFSEYDRILGRDDINEIQVQIISKLNFRLDIKSISYWIEILVGQWEKFIPDSSLELIYSEPNIFQKLVQFKNSSGLGVMAFLYQICEISQILTLNFPKPIIVLSVMYLLIRISAGYSKSEWDKGFQFFRIQLSRSANLVFIDKKGCNEIFGDFLNVLGLDLGGIVHCCQSISRFLSYRIIKGVIEDSKKEQCSKDSSLYYYSPDLFRFLAGRLTQ